MKNIVKTAFFIAAILLAVPKIYAQVSVGISISANIAPPPIPEYDQPPCPEDDYLWQPGYWAYDQDAGDYYWVPGVWVAPPTVGFLWTPCYWGFEGGDYEFHQGYWGPHVGFYGGINYGGGYYGEGFAGGGWQGDHFRYNTAVVNVNTTVIHNTYVDRTVINNNADNRTSYNGRGGVTAKPSSQDEQAMHEQHTQPTGEQVTHRQAAHADRSQFAKVNNGQPATVAMNKVNGDHFTPKGTDNNVPASSPAKKPATEQQRVQPQPTVQPQQQRVQPQPTVQPQEQQRVQPQPTVQPQQRVQPQQQRVQPQPTVQPQQQQRTQQHMQSQQTQQRQTTQSRLQRPQRPQQQRVKPQAKSRPAQPQPDKQN